MDIYSIKVGDTVTPEMGLELCKHFKLEYLVKRLQKNLDKYNDFIFDGVSGLPENIASLLLAADQTDLTYLVALPHDLQFGYGILGDEKEEHMVNVDFSNNLISIGVSSWRIYAAVKIVEILGTEELKIPFVSWGFANKS